MRHTLHVILTGATLLGLHTAQVAAAASPVPWECSNYSEEAQARCMQALIDTQRERIGQLEGELKAQQGAVGQLREQMDRQSAATADMQRQLAHPPAVMPAVPPVYSYAYPTPGLGLYPGIGLYFGRPWRYGYGYGYAPGFRLGFGYRPYPGYGYGYRGFGPCRGRWRGC